MVIEQFDVVDMIYLRGTNAQVDFIHPNMAAHPEIRAVFDVAIKPEASRVLNSIGERFNSYSSIHDWLRSKNIKFKKWHDPFA